MSGTPYQYINNTGVIVPDTATIQSTVESEWTGVFGTDLPVDASTPQGVIITTDVTVRNSVVQNNAALANQINPNQAAGVFLDAIAALTGLQREASTFTTVTGMALAGVAGSPVAAGSLVKDGTGNQFALDEDVTLDPVSGAAIGAYTAVNSGPVTCASGTMTIITDVLGLETVTNSGTTITLGTATQSDEVFRVLRRNTLALQGTALIGAIISAMFDVSGVIGVQALENITNATVVIQGVTLVSHSIWVCVDGGSVAGISTSLLSNKSSGANWNGDHAVSVVEPISGQAYLVKWAVPSPVPILVQVTISQGTFQGNPTAAVIQAVLDFANNAIEGTTGIVLGESVSPFEIASGIMSECPGLYIKNVQLSLASSVSYAPAELPMLIFQKATVASGNISVIIA